MPADISRNIIVNQQWLLASRPDGHASEDDFRLVKTPLPSLADGEVLVRNHYLSLDPYMRARMNADKSYAEPQALDAVMVGGTAGEVIASRHARYAVGDSDSVTGMGGWQQFWIADGGAVPAVLRKIDSPDIPLAAYLGVLGIPGLTAWYGLNAICRPQPGQAVVVSAAGGAVGSVVGQLAKARGCRVIGFAGGPEKCAYVVDELGFDACIDYRCHAGPDVLFEALRRAAPDGVDAGFENAGGPVLDATMQCMNPFGRIAMCGVISAYDGGAVALRHPGLIVSSRLLLQGFIISEHRELWTQAFATCRWSAEVPRDRGRRHRIRAGGVPRHAQGPQLRQATREGDLTAPCRR